MSANSSDKNLWGMQPRSSEGDIMLKKRITWFAAGIFFVLAAIISYAITTSAYAQGNFPNQPADGCWGGGGNMPIAACDWPEWFTDVPSSGYAAQAVEIARQAGIMVGNNADDFQGDRDLTRYEAAIIVARLLDFMAGGQLSLNLNDWTVVANTVTELQDVLHEFGLRIDFFEAYMQNYPTDEEWDAYRAELQSDLGDAYSMLEEHQVALIQTEEWISNEIHDIYLRLEEIEARKLVEGDENALARIEQVRLELLDEIIVSEALELRLDQSLSTIDGVLLGFARQIDDLGLRQDEFDRALDEMRNGHVTYEEFEQSQADQDEEIAALWVAIADLRATIESGSAASVSFSGQITADDALNSSLCGLWYATTDSNQMEVTLATHRNYRGDMSLTFGRYAAVEILDYSFPHGWNTGQEASQPGLKETRWYAESPSLDSQVSVTVGNGSGATCTVVWNVYHR